MFQKLISICLGILCLHTIASEKVYENQNPTPTVEIGAQVFAEYCVLCHGAEGLGDGVLAQRLAAYPDTNLTKGKKASTFETLIDVTVYGGVLENVSEHMPPFGNELTWTKTQSVALFIDQLRVDRSIANKKLEKIKESGKSSLRQGQKIFSHRCSLCHGEYGEGDGRMAKVIKNPSPADLTASRVDRDYLTLIIREGGEGVGRSTQMPPWKNEFSNADLLSIILYLESIRD